MTNRNWSSDTSISKPVVNEDLVQSVSVPFQGFAFTPMGLTFDLTEADAQEFYSTFVEPEDSRG